ncbi:SNF2 family N-terminal domain-containing protein [Xylariomycetidae sp. FL0641]|nr:SNF2 family N-terminal domain-containing protein [Xylariomycetidae sp. FL0641]
MPELVCFGSMTGLRVRILNVSSSFLEAASRFSTFHIGKAGAFYGIRTVPNDAILGVFGKKTCQQFGSLLQTNHQLKLEAYTQDASTLSARRQNARTPEDMRVDVNIYGVREDAARVSKLVSSSGACLQQPLVIPANTTYYNPHFLHVQEILGHHVSQTPFFAPSESISQPALTREESTSLQQSPADLRAEVNSLLSSQSYRAIRHRKKGPLALKTSLKEHQVDAVDFMLRRETDAHSSDLSLWESQELDDDEVVYQHVISGSRRPAPAEAKGGILADEMGLGKTVISLALIAGSLSRSIEFVSEPKGEHTEEGHPERSRATLVIVPSSLLIDSWIDELQKHIYPGHITYHKYHGQQRDQDQAKLSSSDIIFTTYATVASEANKHPSLLANKKWFRIILDEAHDIRNRSTKQFQAIHKLAGEYKWCLTGTPIQNSLEDLGALVAFVRVPIMDNPVTFRRFIVSEAKSTGRNRFKNLKLLVRSICLRRTKEVIGLAEPVQITRQLEMPDSERQQYDELLFRCRTRIDMHVSGILKGFNSGMLKSLLELRLFCNNGRRGLLATSTDMDADETLSLLQQSDQAICSFCSRSVYSISRVPGADGATFLPSCSHLVCRDCDSQGRSKNKCQQCASGIQAPALKDPALPQRLNHYNAIDTNQGIQYPSKLLAFLEDVRQQKYSKCIVFSSWKKTLDLVGNLLGIHHLRFYCIHGSLPLSERRRVLHDFQAPHGANILLMTLGTGAVGLNLAAASRIYLLEPQWNPLLEQQAFGRATRLGQTEQVTIIRYVMKDTVEDSNVLSRQAKKLRLASGGFEKQPNNSQTDRVRALQGYFGVSATPQV